MCRKFNPYCAQKKKLQCSQVVRHTILVRIYVGSIPATAISLYLYNIYYMVKKIEVLIKFNIFSSEASSKEPIGPTLGQYGVPVNDFCDIFNNLTNEFKEKTLIRTRVIVFSDHSFEISIQLPSIFLFLKNSFNKIYENIFNLKRKAGYFDLNYEYLISFDKKIIYIIIMYISNLGIKKILNKKSLFKKIKGLIHSSGFLLYTY